MAKNINEKEFKDLVLTNDGGVVVVDFFAEWCPPCKMLGPILEEVCQEQEVNLYKVNSDNNESLARNNKVMALPTVLIFVNGEEKERMVGFKPKAALEEIIKNYK